MSVTQHDGFVNQGQVFTMRGFANLVVIGQPYIAKATLVLWEVILFRFRFSLCSKD